MSEYPLESFVFYRSFRDAIEVMSPDDQLKTFLAICDYALYGIESELSGMPFAVFTVAKPSINANRAKREGGKKGGRPRKNAESGGDEVPNAPALAGGGHVPRSRFTPPTVEEVRAYCRERKNGVDAERFVDFYASKGWKVGREPMKDWQACVRTWERRDRDNGNGGGNGTPFEYDPGDMSGSL